MKITKERRKMTVSNNEKKDETFIDSVNDKVVSSSKVNFGAKGLHARVAQAQNTPPLASSSNRFINFNRIFILPDTSGSMDSVYDGASASELSKQAIAEYLKNCNATLNAVGNAVGIASFPELVFVPPTQNFADVLQQCEKLSPTGGTPLAEAFGYILEEEQFTHAVIISDGAAESPAECIGLARAYKTKNITVDTVHIGDSRGGEELLKQIAEITGGIYIKFTDVLSFAKNFAYLTPAKRTQLLTSANPIALLGASDVKL